jgi:hypothetical protein
VNYVSYLETEASSCMRGVRPAARAYLEQILVERGVPAAESEDGGRLNARYDI